MKPVVSNLNLQDSQIKVINDKTSEEQPFHQSVSKTSKLTIGTASKSAEKKDRKERKSKGKSKDKDLLSASTKKTGEKTSARRLKTRSLDLKGGAGKKFMVETKTRLEKLETYM